MLYRQWVARIILAHGKQPGTLHFIFCSDTYLASLNTKYLHHETLTDILTFDFSTGSAIQGDVYISIPRIRENALIYNAPFDEELRRVMAHGILHLLGFADKSPGEKKTMRKEEDKALSEFRIMRVSRET